MPRAVIKALEFPLAGVGRRGSYREQATPPYATPWAVNVRGESTLEHRKRGGSRPGLVKVSSTRFGDNITAVVPVTYIDANGARQQDLIVVADGSFSTVRGITTTLLTANLLADDGSPILTDDGVEIVFPSGVSATNPIGDTDAFDAVERNGILYLADSTLCTYNPITGIVETVTASSGEIPVSCPLVTLYQDRIILAGADQTWYASRQGDPTDWAFGGDPGDTGRPFAGQVEKAGLIGGVIQALIVHGEGLLTIATRNSIFLVRGNPAADGSMVEVSRDIGVLSPTAWARAPDNSVAFLSSDGVYVFGGAAGEQPVRWSAERVPDELKNIDPDTNTITMAYDARWRGFHLFITPATGIGTHWWLDLNKTMWPVLVPEGQQPVAVARQQGNTEMSEVVFGCRDGYLRKFDDTATNDDGIPIESHVLLGPVRLATDDLADACMSELHGIFADNSGTIAWRAITGRSAEEVADAGVTAINADLTGAEHVVYPTGLWTENHNRTTRPRARGAWGVVWLASKDRWAYDSVSLKINQLGRLR